MMHSGTPETGQKSRFFDLFSPRKRYELSLILFLVLWSVPQTNSSTEEAITSQSSTLSVAFRSGFLPISPKTGFFHAKCVSKRSPTASLVVVTLCSKTLKVLGCFLFIFATAVANTSSARARTKKSTQKCQKSRFCDFCTKIALFSLKTGAKAHTQLQQGKTSMHK